MRKEADCRNTGIHHVALTCVGFFGLEVAADRIEPAVERNAVLTAK
jgi:hypothetical protein